MSSALGGASVYAPPPPPHQNKWVSWLHVCAPAAERAKTIQYGGAEGGGASTQEVEEVLRAGHLGRTGQTGAVHVLHPGFCTYTEGGEQNGGQLKNEGMRSRRSYCRLFSSQFEAHRETRLTFLILGAKRRLLEAPPDVTEGEQRVHVANRVEPWRKNGEISPLCFTGDFTVEIQTGYGGSGPGPAGAYFSPQNRDLQIKLKLKAVTWSPVRAAQGPRDPLTSILRHLPTHSSVTVRAPLCRRLSIKFSFVVVGQSHVSVWGALD